MTLITYCIHLGVDRMFLYRHMILYHRMRSRLSTDPQAHTVTPAASYVLKSNLNQLASFNIYEYHELFKGDSYT